MNTKLKRRCWTAAFWIALALLAYHQYQSRMVMVDNILVVQEELDEQKKAISTVVNILQEEREEKKQALAEKDSLRMQWLKETQELELQRDSIRRAQQQQIKRLKHEIQKLNANNEPALSPLEQRYRSKPDSASWN